MMSLNRWFLLLMLSGGVAACAPTDSGSANEALGKKQQAIWDGGSTTTNPSGMNGGVVKLEVSGGTKSPMGTGMALNNRWVLTAQHVRGLHQYGAVKATPFGATSSYVAKAGWVVNAGPCSSRAGPPPALCRLEPDRLASSPERWNTRPTQATFWWDSSPGNTGTNHARHAVRAT